MRRLALALFVALATVGIVPAGAAAQALYVSSQKDPAPGGDGITGLVQLSDGGGETLRNGAGGSAIAGTGGGPIVYTASSGGVIRQLSGNSYRTLATGVGSGIRSMTVTGRGLVVANGNKLQYLSGGHLGATVPHTDIGAVGPWISITTEPNGLLLGWAFRGGEGRLYEFNLGSGAVDQQDFSHATSPTLNNCVPLESPCTKPPVPFAGSISADGLGGIWIAGAGTATGTIPDSQSSQLYYAPNNSFSFNSIDVMLTRPHVSATGAGGAYVSSTDNAGSPYFGDVYRWTSSANNAGNIATAPGDISDSYIATLAVDRCYTFCSVSGPPIIPGNGGGGGGNTGTSKSPLTASPTKSVKLGKKGLGVKLKCSVACSVSISGSLTFGKAKKASTSASSKIKTVKAKLKAGKSKTVVLKLSKKLRKKVKKALKRKQKVVAKLKIVVKAPGVKTVTKRPKLRVK